MYIYDVKKVGVYILIPIILFNTYINEVFKLPLLVSHYIEHVELDNKISVLRFLSMHYWGEDIDDNDQDKDNQLPFKKIDAQLAIHIALPFSRILLEKRLSFTFNSLRPLFKDGHFSNPALESLFRPPQS